KSVTWHVDLFFVAIALTLKYTEHVANLCRGLKAAPTFSMTMTITSNAVRTRFAPSPTGFLHLGGARTALFSWAFARHHRGTFVFRNDNIDLVRYSPEAVQAIIDGMEWLGLTPDEGPFYQMQRMDRYREGLQGMLVAGTAYYCYS